MFCANCGKSLNENDKFCPDCGWSVGAGSAPSSTIQTQGNETTTTASFNVMTDEKNGVQNNFNYDESSAKLNKYAKAALVVGIVVIVSDFTFAIPLVNFFLAAWGCSVAKQTQETNPELSKKVFIVNIIALILTVIATIIGIVAQSM